MGLTLNLVSWCSDSILCFRTITWILVLVTSLTLIPVLASENLPELKCLSSEFPCVENHHCIPNRWLCDGEYDCKDSSDEKQCGMACPESEFTCSTGTCLKMELVCDGKRDCPGGEDEGNHCGCSEDMFDCGNNQCIEESWRCDGENDCENMKDEEGCGDACGNSRCQHQCRSTPTGAECYCNSGYELQQDGRSCSAKLSSCKNTDFACGDGNCISSLRVCDGEKNCDNNKDEEGCHRTMCRPDELKCSDGQCVPETLSCDGKKDCLDGTDENDCPASKRTCKENEFTCQNGICVDNSLVCDDKNDCEDYSDEQNCACPETLFDCGNGRCIEKSWRCDWNDDCGNMKDEEGCDLPCKENEFLCQNGICINNSLVCDRNSDCEDNSDEKDCVGKRSQRLFVVNGGYLLHVQPDAAGDKAVSTLPVDDMEKIGDIAYDEKRNTIFISDIIKKTILAVNGTSFEKRVIVRNDIQAIGGMDYDPMGNNLYWTDYGKGTVEMFVLETSERIILLSGLPQPVGLALLPKKRLMFVSMIGGNPYVSMFHMDGRNEKKLPVTGLPLSLVLDPVETRLHYADPRSAIIASVDYLNPNQTTVVHKNDVNHVVSIAVSETFIYWTTTTSDIMYRIDRRESGTTHSIPLKRNDRTAVRKIKFIHSS